MVEIHEPVRLLFIIETTPEAMLRIMDRNAVIGRLCRNGWVQLAALDPESSRIHVFHNGAFEVYQAEPVDLPKVAVVGGLVSRLARPPGVRRDRPGLTVQASVSATTE